jgi:tetratricopeptide (TPR) repeat protein
LAIATGNVQRHSQALTGLAYIKWQLGDYQAGQRNAYEAQRLAKISADLWREASALQIETACWVALGKYKHALHLSSRARDLLTLCGMSGGQLDHNVMSTQAEIHMLKSEYLEARNIHSQTLSQPGIEQAPYHHALSLVNIAEIGVPSGAQAQDVQENIEKAKSLFTTIGFTIGVTMCEAILADLYLREGDMQVANSFFQKCLRFFLKCHSEMVTYCLERLGNGQRWCVLDWTHWRSSWTTVYLAHALKSRQKLDIHKALQFLGDVFQTEGEQDTAVTLFTVALDGFTQMDVHRSRAECMLRLGDFSKGQGDLLKAVEFWKTARPLFEQSSQATRVTHVDKRLALVSDNILEEHTKSLARPTDMHPPTTAIASLDIGTSDSLAEDEVASENLVVNNGREHAPV